MLDTAALAGNTEAQPGNFIAVTVADTGAGMTPEVMAKAFEPFFTTKPIGQGTGLGLSQVFGFARQLGGHVAILSKPGQGSSVTIFLPTATMSGSTSNTPLFGNKNAATHSFPAMQSSSYPGRDISLD